MTERDFETNRVKDLPATESPGRGCRAAVAVRASPAPALQNRNDTRIPGTIRPSPGILT